MKPPFAPGKLPLDVLERLLRHVNGSPLVAVGPGPGEDAAVVRGSQTIVLTADPVTFSDERVGAYVAAVNANDIVAMGGAPVSSPQPSCWHREPMKTKRKGFSPTSEKPAGGTAWYGRAGTRR